ncbi:NAF1-domain-containing protein [Lactarius vividus]|nr:NAF1-domain-containing protein [Lactarius vividus]
MEAANEGFKIPSTIPQDLFLIRDLIGPVIPPVLPTLPVDVDDSVDSSGESADSADEVEANLISVGTKSEREDVSDSFSDSSSSDSDPSSDSDSDNVKKDDASKKTPVERRVVDEDDEDDEEGGAVAAAVALRTKNELPEPDIMIPPIAQVEPDEQLEKVGEIMNIVNNVVVVKGEASSTHRASEHALDSETLLVYEDRKVLGYVSAALPLLLLTPRPFAQIHETFGPTYQPLYQIKFNSAHPLDLNEARVSRPVFHVPARSKYVFVAELTKLRGSDASNVHDEEPAEYELEFSDDEAEATYKAKLRERRHGSREPSVPASPAHMRDQDLDAWNPYAAHGAYDIDYGASPSRPAPQPYDDPYSDAYNQPGASASVATSVPTLPPHPGGHAVRGNRGRGRGRDDHRPHHHRERGRGRSRGRGRGRGRGHPPHRAEEHGPRSLSPPSTTIAQAVGRSPIPNASYPGGGGSSDYSSYSPQLQQFGFAQPYTSLPQPFVSPQHSVQPHINPRFAGQFGLNLDMMQQQQQQQSYFAYGQYGAEGGWDGQWNQGYGSGSGGEHHDGQGQSSQGT